MFLCHGQHIRHNIAILEGMFMNESNKSTSLEKEIGLRIMVLRGSETQEELAAAIGVSREIIQHWERGTRYIKAAHLRLLSEHFGKSVDYLLGLVPEDKSTNDEKLRKVSEYTGLGNDAARKLNEWTNSDDRRSLFSDILSRLVNSDHSEALLGAIAEYITYSQLEIDAANNDDLNFAVNLIDLEMARLWNISRLFSNAIEELGSEEREGQ